MNINQQIRILASADNTTLWGNAVQMELSTIKHTMSMGDRGVCEAESRMNTLLTQLKSQYQDNPAMMLGIFSNASIQKLLEDE